MSGKSRSLAMVVVGILVSMAIIGGVTVLQRDGILPAVSSGSSNLASSSTATYEPTSSPSVSQTNTATKRPTGNGSLVLQIHDPPRVPSSVSAVFLTYSDIAIYSVGGMGWLDLKQSGTIDLLSVVNFTQTIANTHVSASSFDVFSMSLSSAVVVANSTNYTATLLSKELTVPIRNGLVVESNKTAGAVIDVATSVLQHSTYNNSGAVSPSFLLSTTADAYTIPSDQLNQSQSIVGYRDDFKDEGWLRNEINNSNNQSSFEIVSASLSNSSFFLNIKNTGNYSLIITSVFIALNTSTSPVSEGEDGTTIGNSVVFGVLSNGTLIPYSLSTENEYEQETFANSGYNLSAHSQITLSYWGPIPPHSETSSNVSEDDWSEHTTSNWSGTNTMSSAQSYNYGGSSGFAIVAGQSYIVGVISGRMCGFLIIAAS
jgi:hypothetical protein